MTRLRPGSLEAHRLEIVLLLGARQHGDLALDLRRDDDGGRAFLGGLLLDRVGEGVALVGASLVDVADVEHRLRGQEAERCEQLVLLAADPGRARRAALAQLGEAALGERRAAPWPPCRRPWPSSPSRRRAARGFRDRPASVRSRSSRYRRAGSMRPSTWVTSPSSKQRTTWAIASHSRILARNWLPSPSPLEAPRTRPAMSTKVSRVGMISFEPAISRQRVQPRIGHRDVADVGLDGAERIVGRLRRGGLRQRVEERRLADIRQADDAAFEAHGGERSRELRDGAALCAGARQKARASVSPLPHVGRRLGRGLPPKRGRREAHRCAVAGRTPVQA